MGYEISLDRAWKELKGLSASKEHTTKFLCDIYRINVDDDSILCQSSGKGADDFLAVLILHYLIGLLKHGYRPSGEWISFKEVWGGNSYYPAFRESTLKPLVESFKSDPEGLLKKLNGCLGGRIVEGGDISIGLIAFPEVLIRVVIWYGDDELTPEVTMLFDRSLAEIISTEDIAVLLHCIAKRIVSLRAYS